MELVINKKITKGAIFYADLDPIIGSEQNGVRPVLIIQNDIGNKYSPTTIIAPITSKTKTKSNIPTHILIKANDYIKHDSLILLEQIRVIDKTRLRTFLYNISNEEIDEVNSKIIIALGIKI